MNRPVKISFALNGFVAEVGCQTLVFNDLDELLGNLRSYLQDPEAVETSMRKSALNTKITLGNQPQPLNGGYAANAPAPEPWPTEAAGQRTAALYGNVAAGCQG